MISNKIFISHKFQCPASELFEWITDPHKLILWFGPEQLSVFEVNVDLRVGGQYSFELEKPNGDRFCIEGTYLDIARPEILTFSFNYRKLSPTPPESVVKIKIESLTDTECQLLLTQEFVSIPKDIEARTTSWNNMFGVLNDLFTN